MSALIVEPTLADALFCVSTLSAVGFQVTVAEGFHEAKARLGTGPPTLMITEVRLGEYNGLQLVLRAKATRPAIAALVTSRIADPVLQQDAERMGATFVLKPVPSEEFLAAVFRTLLRGTGSAAAEPIRPPFERRRYERRMPEAVRVAPDRRVADRRQDVATILKRAAGA